MLTYFNNTLLYFCKYYNYICYMEYTEDYTNYFYHVWNNLPESIVSEEYYTKNEELFGAITFDMYHYDQQCNCLPPFLAGVAIQRIFENILINGLR